MMGTVVAILIVSSIAAAVYAENYEGGARPLSRAAWIRTIGYWVCTLLTALEMAAGGLWDLLRIEFVRVVLTHLGYPLYLLSIIGVWKIPCATVLLIPRFPRLKEWAYAGAVFNYTGAAASHWMAGDRADKWIGPLVFTAITLASWALRAPERRLVPQGPAAPPRTVAWVVPIVITAAFLVFALATLPQGPPPQ